MNTKNKATARKRKELNDDYAKSRLQYHQHRAMRSYKLPKSILIEMFLLPMLFSLFFFGVLEYIANGWSKFFDFWADKLNLPLFVITKVYGWDWLAVPLPFIEIPSVFPSLTLWVVILMITLAVIVLSLLLPAKLLPLSYLLRVVAFIQLTSQAFFWWNAESYLYTAAGQTESLLVFTVLLMFLVPWMHALTYYIFNYSRPKKVLFTFLTLLMLVVFAPFHVMFHAYFLINYSLLMMPLLFFLFGVLMPIMICVALYGWSMSWERAT